MKNVVLLHPRDRISNLPDNVMENILIYLPTRDAARTSILSRSWRHVFSKLPQFVLDKKFWASVPKQSSAEIGLVKILYHLLLRHDGPIIKFALSNPKLSSCLEIDSLIFLLAKSHLEDFTLKMWRNRYLLPHSLFSCQKLRHLRLRLCSIRSSPAYEGFSKLTSLVLIEVTISAERLASLISGSPLLGLLEVSTSSRIDISIDAPNLKTFIFHGYTESINFKRVPLLASVSIKQVPHKTVNFVGVQGDHGKFFEMLPVIESLKLSYQSVMGFVIKLQNRLPTPLIYLKDLKLSRISFNFKVFLSFTLCLLRSSPNLKFLDILFVDFSNSNSENTITYMEGEGYSDICLNELQKVKMDGFRGTKLELEFTRLLLLKSSSLKKIQILPKKDVAVGAFKLVEEVLQFQRVSKEAKIMFAE